MADIEKVKQGLFRCFMKCNEPFDVGCGQCPYVGTCFPDGERFETSAPLYTETVALIDEMQAEIERLHPKKGKWLEYAGDQKCSVCGSMYSDLFPEYDRTPFCPHCGAKMESGDGK